MADGWSKYQKTGITRAQKATAQGVISTLEGPVPYKVGDYLCIGVKGERWPQPGFRFEGASAVFERVSGPDEQGYTSYRKTALVLAQRQDGAFSAELAAGTTIDGKAGDWLIHEGSSTWIVDADVFAASYKIAGVRHIGLITSGQESTPKHHLGTD
jgi:hypothetical protein